MRALWRAYVGDECAQPLEQLRTYLFRLAGARSAMLWLESLQPPMVAYLRSVAGGESFSEPAINTLECDGKRQLLGYCRNAGLLRTDVPIVSRGEAVLEQLAGTSPAWIALALRQFWTFYLKRVILQRPLRVAHCDPDLRGDRRFLHFVHRFLLDLDHSARRLDAVDQPFIDTWLLAHLPSQAAFLKRFVSWALPERRLRFPREALSPADGACAEAYRDLIAQIHGDSELDRKLRAALVLITLFQQNATRIVRLRACDVMAKPGGALLCLPRGPALAASPASARVLVRLAKSSKNWLFPSPVEPTRPMKAATLCCALREVTSEKLPALRIAGLRDLFYEHEPAEVSRIFGFSLSFVVRWNKRLGNSAKGIREYLAWAGDPEW